MIRRRRKGRRTLCSRVTRPSLSATSCTLNQESKSSAELKTSGRRKLRRAHSSCRLFWRGVPVRRRRFVDLNSRTTIDSLDFSFLILQTENRVAPCSTRAAHNTNINPTPHKHQGINPTPHKHQYKSNTLFVRKTAWVSNLENEK